MDRRSFNTALAAASLSSLLASSPRAQQQTAPQAKPRIGMIVYSDMIMLDLTGPLTVFNILQGDIRLIARTKQPVLTELGLPVMPTDSFETSPSQFDVLFVPGGLKGTIDAMKDLSTVDFVRTVGRSSRYVTSVCTGSLLLGAAGLLKGYNATSHWYVRDFLPLMGGIRNDDRVVEDRNRITGGGVTAGIDFALLVAARLSGEDVAKRIQLLIEYDPNPPFAAGSPEQAGPSLTEDILGRRGALIREAEQVARAAGRKLGI